MSCPVLATGQMSAGSNCSRMVDIIVVVASLSCPSTTRTTTYPHMSDCEQCLRISRTGWRFNMLYCIKRWQSYWRKGKQVRHLVISYQHETHHHQSFLYVAFIHYTRDSIPLQFQQMRFTSFLVRVGQYQSELWEVLIIIIIFILIYCSEKRLRAGCGAIILTSCSPELIAE